MRVVNALAFGVALALGGTISPGCVPVLPTARLDPGGVTVDFQKASDERFRIPGADTTTALFTSSAAIRRQAVGWRSTTRRGRAAGGRPQFLG